MMCFCVLLIGILVLCIGISGVCGTVHYSKGWMTLVRYLLIFVLMPYIFFSVCGSSSCIADSGVYQLCYDSTVPAFNSHISQESYSIQAHSCEKYHSCFNSHSNAKCMFRTMDVRATTVSHPVQIGYNTVYLVVALCLLQIIRW